MLAQAVADSIKRALSSRFLSTIDRLSGFQLRFQDGVLLDRSVMAPLAEQLAGNAGKPID
ncbi:hypothetical protein QW131_09845 [Roseibium salinum]|nr:hypothetical protein [Roseibium salinum]